MENGVTQDEGRGSWGDLGREPAGHEKQGNKRKVRTEEKAA